MSQLAESIQFCDDFIRGQIDCQNGVKHEPGQSEAYYRGYNAEYELEQIKAELTKNGH